MNFKNKKSMILTLMTSLTLLPALLRFIPEVPTKSVSVKRGKLFKTGCVPLVKAVAALTVPAHPLLLLSIIVDVVR